MPDVVFPKRATVVHVSDGLGYNTNDEKYVGRALNKVFDVVDSLGGGLLLTNFYMPEFKGEVNDYCRHGFLIVSNSNIEYI